MSIRPHIIKSPFCVRDGSYQLKTPIILAERGIGSAHLLLWIAVISFEYYWRYRGDSPLHLLKSSTLGSTLNIFTGDIFKNFVLTLIKYCF